jgi:DNA-binding response OmpR family regulator
MTAADHIVIAEDDADFVLLLQTAFESASISVTLHPVTDGLNAMNYLRGDGIYADRGRYPWPKAVLLDLRLPRTSGWEVLRWIRSRPEWNRLGVAILTGAEMPGEGDRLRNLGADLYLVKPIAFDGLVEVAEQVAHLCDHSTATPIAKPMVG